MDGRPCRGDALAAAMEGRPSVKDSWAVCSGDRLRDRRGMGLGERVSGWNARSWGDIVRLIRLYSRRDSARTVERSGVVQWQVGAAEDFSRRKKEQNPVSVD